jgi:FkbM family methyltransferase
MFSLSELIEFNGLIRILDLGAMAFPGESSSYEKLLNNYPCRIMAIEPNVAECRKLDARYGPNVAIDARPITIFDGSPAQYRVTRMASRSSLFEPNIQLCNHFNAMAEFMEVVDRRQVSTSRLDDIAGSFDADFAKLDLQGSELEAIRCGQVSFASTMIVEVEVEFVEQYLGQPLHGDIDCVMRDAGFMFHTFLGYGTRALKPWLIDNNPLNGVRQWLWADAVYVRPFEMLHEFSADKLLKAAIILHDVYESYDFAHFALSCIDKRCGSRISESYLARCGQI